MPVIVSFDVEEHDRIEAATGLVISPAAKAYYRERLGPPTRWILEELERARAKATFFVVGQIAQHSPDLVRAIRRAGHEVASHGWDHRRVTTMTPNEFRRDIRQSKDALEQVTGEAVHGYRAPTFSIGKTNPWAIDVLAEEGFAYDSSIYPVRHDRYGVPGVPRVPFMVYGNQHSILELPPATWRIFGLNIPMGGGGYFRLFPLWFINRAIGQGENGDPPVAMLYFHPWEFDPEQQRLPLGRMNAFRTYVGLGRGRGRLAELLGNRKSCRAIDAVRQIDSRNGHLGRIDLSKPASSKLTLAPQSGFVSQELQP